MIQRIKNKIKKWWNQLKTHLAAFRDAVVVIWHLATEVPTESAPKTSEELQTEIRQLLVSLEIP